MGNSNSKDVWAETWSGLKTVLTVLETCVDGIPAPGVKGAISGILDLSKNVDLTKQNASNVDRLRGHLEELVSILQAHQVDETSSPELKARIKSLDDKFSVISVEIGKLASRKPFQRAFTGADDAEKLKALILQMDRSIQIFMTETTLSIESTLRRLEADKEKERERLETDQRREQNLRDDAALKELFCNLRLANVAQFNSSCRETAPRCSENTRVELLRTIEEWIQSGESNSPQIFWLNGLAGTGKSTIAQTVAEGASQKGILGASFFFSRNTADQSNASLVFPSIAYQLAEHYRPFKSQLAQIVQSKRGLDSLSFQTQLKELIIEPWNTMTSIHSPLVIVIDALDECGNRQALLRFISSLATEIHDLSSPFRVFMTSRPEADISSEFHSRVVRDNVYAFALHEVPSSIIRCDIHSFLYGKLQELVEQRSDLAFPNTWPPQDHVKTLEERAENLFIYASTAMEFIKDPKYLPWEQLKILVNTNHLTVHTSPYVHLDHLYLQVLNDDLPKGCPQDFIESFQENVGAVVLAWDTLSPEALGGLLRTSANTVRVAFRGIHSLVQVPSEGHTPIRVVHTSFRDFLTTHDRCADPRFFIDVMCHHGRLALACLEAMEHHLIKENICNMVDSESSMLNSELDNFSGRIAKHMSPDLQYACRHWAAHLCETSAGRKFGPLLNALDSFVNNLLLRWMEALSLMGCLREAVRALQRARDWLSNISHNTIKIQELLFDGERMVSQFFIPIDASALQVYQSALAFSPSTSHIRRRYYRTFQNLIPVLGGLDEEWGQEVFTLEGHLERIESTVFSPDGKHIASGSADKTIRIWDVKTATHVSTLKGHLDWVSSVAFSPDGKYVASGSGDRTIRVWSVETGAQVSMLERHSDWFSSVAFSPDGKCIAAGSGAKTIEIWDVTETGAQASTLEGHSDWVSSVSFSSDGKHIASGSADKTVRIWDARTATNVFTLEGHLEWVWFVAFSPDGKHIASGSSDKTIQIWDVERGTHVATFKGHSNWVSSLAFSPDGKCIASGSGDRTVRVWNVETRMQVSTLEGHSDWVSSVSFSSDGKHIASGSADKTIRIWDAEIGTYGTTFDSEGHSEWVWVVAFSPDGMSIVSGSGDRTVRIWNARTGAHISTFEGHLDWVSSVAFSPDGKRIASGSGDKTVRVWDVEKGTQLSTLEGHSDRVSSISFSPNGKHLASGSGDETVRVWDIETGTPVFTLEGHSQWVSSVAFSSNGKRIASGSGDKSIRVWDAETGTHIFTLEGHSQWVSSIAFSTDGNRIASGSDGKTVRVWHVPTHAAARVSSVAFLPDGQHIAAESDDNTSPICDTKGSMNPSISSENCDTVSTVTFDGGWLISKKASTSLRICWLPPKYRGIPTLYRHMWKIALPCRSDGRIRCLDVSHVIRDILCTCQECQMI